MIGLRSQVNTAKEQHPLIRQAYAEHDVKLTDWTGKERTPIHGEPTAKKLQKLPTSSGTFCSTRLTENLLESVQGELGTGLRRPEDGLHRSDGRTVFNTTLLRRHAWYVDKEYVQHQNRLVS